jgi:formylglycine-generating enzyme required for sulfatase activity
MWMEWKKVACGMDGRIWPWGNEAPDKQWCNFNHNVGDTTPVDAYPKGSSPYGVLDMAGNVWEWTTV